jgi:hypothetical protein
MTKSVTTNHPRVTTNKKYKSIPPPLQLFNNQMRHVGNANFPMDDELRTYHVGAKSGEVANRIITVGDHARADRLATMLDENSIKTRVSSKRGFLTITGEYKSIPVSIIAIGMVFITLTLGI